jgi:hypothetical protein
MMLLLSLSLTNPWLLLFASHYILLKGLLFVYSGKIYIAIVANSCLIGRIPLSLVKHTMADSVVVKAKIKEIATGYNVAGDFSDALDRKVREMIKMAVKRAEGNNRKTVMAKDL